MWEIDNFHNESDVEQKFVFPLLTAGIGLGWPATEVISKQYIREHSIGKRKSKKGHIPDYIAYSTGMPVLVIEVKPPSDNCDDALREAAQYALEINGGFPSNFNPVTKLIATNGVDFWICDWDNIAHARKYDVVSFKAGASALAEVVDKMHFTVLTSEIKEARRKSLPEQWYNPMRLAGGLSVENQTERLNHFAKDLEPLLNKYLSKDYKRDLPEIVQRAYVSTAERTEYERSIEMFLKDNLAARKRPDVTEIVTAEKTMHTPLYPLIGQPAKDRRVAITLLIGNVGAGKSIFIDRLYQEFLSDDVKSNILWVVIDFNYAPRDIGAYKGWIVKSFVEGVREYAASHGIDLEEYGDLKKLFGNELRRRAKLLKGGKGGMSEDEFEAHMRKHIVEWAEDDDRLIEGMFSHFSGERNMHVVVVFDNADKGTSTEQIAVFQECLAFSGEWPCSCILSMRDETYDIYKGKPPLDSVAKTRTYRVAPPRLVDVVHKRLVLMIEFLESNLPEKLSYYTPGGAVIEYDRADLSDYLHKIFNDLFSNKRLTRTILESLAGKDIRKALEMFVSILVSPYLTSDDVGFGAKFKNNPIPEWRVIRTLMRSRYAYYSDRRGESYIHNIFQVSEKTPSGNNFLLAEILTILVRDRKRTGELGAEGYRRAKKLYQAPELIGYSNEDIRWGLNYLIANSCLVTESGGDSLRDDDDCVKATASGYFHCKIFPKRDEYIANVAMSTWMQSYDVAAAVSDSMQTRRPGRADSYTYRMQRYQLFRGYLRDVARYHKRIASAGDERLGGLNYILDSLSEIDDKISEAKSGTPKLPYKK